MSPDSIDGIHTRLLHAGSARLRDGTGPVNVPVVRTSTVRFDNIETLADRHHRRTDGERIATYGRHGLDTHEALEDALCTLEGGYRAFLSPSGLSAITLVLLAMLGPGDHALVTDTVYAPLRRVDQTLLQRLGVTVEYFSPAHDDLDALIRPQTRLVYLESPGSLVFDVLDLPALAAIAHARGVPVAIDNTWSGGWFLQPLKLGVNISIQAATKYIAGHSDVMQGAVIVDSPTLAARVGSTHEALGLTIGADDAYLALRGLRTLPVRLAQHQRNATEVAQWLQQQDLVARTFYPALPTDPGHALWKRDFTGASGLVSFALHATDPGAAGRFVNALRLFSIGASWGGYESLALIAPPERLNTSRSWQQNGNNAPVIRLHVGLEDPQDLIADLRQAFLRTIA